MKKPLITLFLIFCTFNVFSQGAIDGFYKGKGNASAVLGFGFEDSKSYFAGRENIDLSRSLFYGNLYGAYGITNSLDASISIPYLVSDDNSDFQDISIFLKHQIFQKKFENSSLHFTVAGGFSTPLTNYDIGGLNDIGQQATVIETRGLVHYQCDNGWFGTLQSGYSFKFEEVPNSIPFVLKAGRASSDWYYDVFYDFQHSFGGIDYLGTPRPQNFREFGVDYHKLGGTVFKPFSRTLGMYASLSYVLSGRNVFQGPAYGVGLVYNFRKEN